MSLRLQASLSFVSVLALGLALGACGTTTTEEDAAEDQGAQVAEVKEVLATIEGDAAAGTRVAVTGPTRYALRGARIGELAIGKRYSLELAPSLERFDGFEVRELVGLRAVKRVVGTLADDANDPAGMILTSMHAISYALHGDTVATFKEIRTGLPSHDYARTLFEATVLEDKSPSTRYAWLDYHPIPHVRCAQKDSPEVHLDLVDVKPDVSVLDGFVTIPLGGSGGHETRYGAHAECKRAADSSYACALDNLGSAWGAAKLTPAAAGPFDVVVERTDASKLTFRCELVNRDVVAASSDD